MSLKISCPKRRHPGNFGENDLKQALELLFLVKAKQYKTKSPDFLPPTADEFFTFCKFVSEEIYLKRTGGKRIHRSISSEKFHHVEYLAFYESILHMEGHNLYDRLVICISIPLYALFLYYYTGVYMKQSIGLGDEDEQPGFQTVVAHSMKWFCIHVMPNLECCKAEILASCLSLIQSNLTDLQSSMESVGSPKSFYKTAMQFSNIFEKVVVEPGVFDSLLKKHASPATV